MRTMYFAELQALKKQVSEKTEQNDHSEALMDILLFFNYSDLACVLGAVITLHEKHGYITDDLLQIRNRIKETALINIINQYGNQTYQEVKSWI